MVQLWYNYGTTMVQRYSIYKQASNNVIASVGVAK